ncbi:uncharacterized protein LOC125237242 isoform X2 [Leguminivora glycinivorella]|uniref:uncharacterized protein LOC125237242 isoform X2 n=1 Tax=Leguminivora glycinivorella TaxID=1035111 RepID=UPI00200C4D2C|nr:uncharacterized protein LOC125237242 isoform X2 [Leguminivora glycinivorella]
MAENLACVLKSFHSMFMGSTTDLTPTLIGIYDSLLEPKSLRPEASALEKAKDARNDPPVDLMIEEPPKDPAKMVGSVKLPIAAVNKSSLYKRCNGDSDTSEKVQRTFKDKVSETSTFDYLSPNVKRMISSASETTTVKFQRKGNNARSSTRQRSNIPLFGATSKLTQSGVDILDSVEIYDQPCGMKSFGKKIEEESPSKLPLKPDFRIDEQTTYDVPTNNRPAIYDVPVANKTAFESLSLPYIDQSIELSISSNDREFDIKLSSKDNSPQKPVKTEVPSDTFPNGTNSLNRKDFVSKSESPSKLAKSGPYPEVVGSTGNLKTLPAKDTLHPPPIEVTRPLSMSSIASSSSTSSSGVQNKGGVNSAYLASIESLDDHSDADMASANGSNNFVNSAGILNNSATEERHTEIPRQSWNEVSGLSQLERVCAEIVQTENVYVEDLRQVVEGYLHEWRRFTTFSEDELTELFNNIEDIYNFNRSLCEELNTCRLDATCIARCFVNNTSGFSVYTSYCTGYPRTMARLAELAGRSQSAREFRERQLALGHPLPLASYLLKPVQRILKYHLLLQNVVKQSATRETEFALMQMTGIAQHIDDMKRRHEHAVRVQEIQSLLYGWTGPDLTTYGELCAEGTFRVFGAKAMRHAFLFDKMLLVTKNREDGILAYKSHIMCNNMMLVESIAGAPLSFHVIPWDAPRAQLTLQARSPRHKREWTLLLKRVILENYNAVIPSHARQLVMELGQNKTDDDMLAEKSHNLITQASMRKQLSAPEYLEKRKLERERRKSFENGARGRMKKNMKYSVPNRSTSQDCDCAQVSLEKGTDYTCDTCYIDLCSDCEAEMTKKDKDCSCNHDDGKEKCPECDRALQYIDSGSAEHLERKQSVCKCSDFKSSQESFAKEYNGSLNKIRGYHSSDNIVGYTDAKSKDDLSDTNNSLVNVRNIPKSCLKCAKIKENIVSDSTSTIHSRKSRCNDNDKHKIDTLRSKSKEDPQRSKLSKIGTWRRKSEPGLQQNTAIMVKKSLDSDTDRNEAKGTEKIEFECRNCGSNKITRKVKNSEGVIISDPEVDGRKGSNTSLKPTIEIKMYNTKKVPKKISKLKKNRANGLRLGPDTTAKFYADFSTDVSTENILHISESTDSLNVDKSKDSTPSSVVPETISKDEDIDEETYKKLIEKTDSFKKNELEKVKYLNKQKVINEGSETEEKVETREDVPSGEDGEQPLEQIISQLLMQNREFQKLLKKQQLRNTAQRRHQRLLKSHSNPEQPVNKPKYSRQASENLLVNKDEPDDVQVLSPPNEVNDASDDDHIYETLRVENRLTDGLHTLNSKSKSIQHTSHVPRPKRIPSPPNPLPPKAKHVESDYVYLSFDKLNKLQDSEGIYDVPVKSPEKVKTHTEECYETMEHGGPAIDNSTENLYDSLMEICRRKKETPNTLPGEYLPMSPDQSPNTPEIWLSRQKEHFNVSRDRKSGSLPRSFQVIANNQEENNLSSFKCKPNSNSKTYLNRDGKVLSTDRPFTIASDKSEISYDDVENYMSEGDILKFNKTTNSNDSDYVQNISQSTLELEQEIDKCYKNNFEKNLDANKNENLLTVSQPNLNASTTSSCEVLPLESSDDKKDINVIHPEHKIYKPTSNMLSLKNVLSRFKNRSPPKNTEYTEINANDQSSPEIKSETKSPTSEKRPGLNPRSYSKNLLQRFRSIIGDEHADDNQNRNETKKNTGDINNSVKTDIKVVITSTDASPTTSTIVYSANNDPMSKSVYEQTTLTESQNEKNNLETLSHSCDNIPQKPEVHRPNYEKSVSMVTNISNASSPSKSSSNSYQSINKLPIYMQGSKHLGARIAQREYVDPVTLMKEKSALKNVNVLINKNAVRPDSLFSNSSFVTTSSESADHEIKQEIKKDNNKDSKNANADESFYEKSFEKIEHVIDEDVYRDSAVYSDQEEIEESKTESSEVKSVSKTVSRIESIKHSSSFRAQRVTVTSSVCNTKATVAKKIPEINVKPKTDQKPLDKDKPKAPPVPIKPKITSIPTPMAKAVTINKNNLVKTQEQSSSESVNMKIIRRNTSYIHKTKSENVETTEDKVEVKVNENSKEIDGSGIPKPSGNIQIKRLSFERASLDSATRKIKTNEAKRTSVEPQKTSKSVLERRMEIEMMSKSLAKPSQIAQKPGTKPKPISTKVASFERSVSEVRGSKVSFERSVSEAKKDEVVNESTVSNEEREENKEGSDDPKSSWVKQVVNKFQ